MSGVGGCKRDHPAAGCLEHASIPFRSAWVPAPDDEPALHAPNAYGDMLTMSDEMLVAIDSMEQMLDLVRQLNDVTP